MYIFNRITVVPQLPKELKRLSEIANNLWWSWNTEFLKIFKMIDPDLWERIEKNPGLPVHTGGAHLNGVVMGVQPLHPGELCHIRGGVQHGIPVHAHHAGAALELIRP